jgi:tetratricopeptide (TPR) repeat protein
LTSFGQSTRIIYKKRGGTGYPAVISLTDSTGHKSLQPADFLKSRNIYFTITPVATAKKQYFKESDITDYFTGISIKQGDNQFDQKDSPKPLINSSGKITSLILSFSKKDIKLYDSFVFVNRIDTTENMTINEILYPSYDKYKEIFTKAQKLLDNKDYHGAFGMLYQIEKDAQSNPEIEAYSFYSKATIDLSKQAIKNYSDSLYKIFLIKHEVYLKKKNKPSLDSCYAVLQTFNQGFTTFKPYLQIQKDGIPRLKAETLNMRNKMVSKYNADKLMLKQSILALLETGNYSNYKFFLFVNVLNRMICHIDTLKIIDGIPPLDINILNKFPEKTKELISTGWFNEFNNLVELLNDNIKNQHFIFDTDVISHLKLIDTLEREPYYEIFNAFNSLDTNFQNFHASMNQAIVKCTDSTLLTNLDTWMVSYKITYAQVDKRYVTEINRGIKQINNNQWEEAKNTFNIIKRQVNTIAAPWFYSAKINFHNNESFSATAQLDKSLTLYPHYIAPRLFVFKTLIAGKRFPELLKEADTAIYSFNIWYFHYIKAFALFKMNRSQDCIDELLTQCIPVNRWDLKEYYLLGDAYLQLKNFEKAKEAYLKTRDVDPYSSSEYFNHKMQYLYSLQKKAP